MRASITPADIAESITLSSDVCNPGLASPLLGPIDLTATVTGSLQAAGNQLQDVVLDYKSQFADQFNLLALNLKALTNVASISLATSALPSVNTALAKALVQQLQALVVNYAKQQVAGIIMAEINKILNMSVTELGKNLEPALQALKVVNDLAGRAAAQKAIVEAALSGQSCAARAELLSEVYFRMKR